MKAIFGLPKSLRKKKNRTSELTDIDAKDKDKMSSNDIKIIFNIAGNNYLDEFLKDSKNVSPTKSFKKIPKKTVFRNYSIPFKTFKNIEENKNRPHNFNSSSKDLSLNKENSYDDILTIINTSKKNSSDTFSRSFKTKQQPKTNKKKKNENKTKVDMYYSFKFQSVMPQKDYSLKNSSSTVFTKGERRKSKNSSFKFYVPKTNNRELKPLPKFDKRNKRQVLDPKLQKILSKSKNSYITSYLERKKIDNLPVLYPLFLSYNNSYNTQSEKCRVNKILEKFVKLKTQIEKDYKNRERIMSEFLMKNGVNDKKYHTSQKFSNLYEYLKKPFKFDPKKMISDIIKEALEYKYDLIETDRNKFLPVNYFNNFNITNRNKFYRSLKSESLNNIKNEEKKMYQNPICLKFEELKYDKDHFPQLVMELEENLEKIQNEGDEKINKLRGGIKKLKQYKIKDKNKLVPNLCLVNDDFKGQYEYLMKKVNTKLQNNYNREQHIREINDRMYYNNLKKKYHAQGVSDEIKRKLKLTEYIIVQRAKKKMFLEHYNNFNIKKMNSLNAKK